MPPPLRTRNAFKVPSKRLDRNPCSSNKTWLWQIRMIPNCRCTKNAHHGGHKGRDRRRPAYQVWIVISLVVVVVVVVGVADEAERQGRGGGVLLHPSCGGCRSAPIESS